ncbi:MAG: hypothetical protein AAFX79_09170 [Planctomycetota bacterium]
MRAIGRGCGVGVLLVALAAGCDEAPASARAGVPSPAAEPSAARVPPSLLAGLAELDYATSPPGHPREPWPELRDRIAEAWSAAGERAPGVPVSSASPLDQATSVEQRMAIEANREWAALCRAEAALRLARADVAGAADAIGLLVERAGELASSGSSHAAAAADEMLRAATAAVEQPAAAPLRLALDPSSAAGLIRALDGLDATDPVGRRGAMLHEVRARSSAFLERATGPDARAVARRVSRRRTPDARPPTDRELSRLPVEAVALAEALADLWNEPPRPDVERRIRERIRDDETGILRLLLADAAELGAADAELRERLRAMRSVLP